MQSLETQGGMAIQEGPELAEGQRFLSLRKHHAEGGTQHSLLMAFKALLNLLRFFYRTKESTPSDVMHIFYVAECERN